MRMIFCGATSASAEGGTTSLGAGLGGVCLDASTGAEGFGGATVASIDARMREIGGKMFRLGFTSPSSVFLRGFFLSMSETLSCSWLGAAAVRGSVFGASVRDLAGAAASACSGARFGSFLKTFVFGAATG